MPELLTVKQAADFIGITPKAVYLAIVEKRIGAVKMLNKFGVPITEARRFKKYRSSNGNGKQKAA